MGTWLKIGVVVCGAVVITALGIDAADTLSGNDGTMLGQLVGSQTGVCPKGMVEVPQALTFTCIDQFEASTNDECPVTNPSNQIQSKENLNTSDCGAASKSKVSPWRNLAREQAQIACARAGKRLPSSAEWYQAALGTVDSSDSCNVDSGLVRSTGDQQDCRSAAGAMDMIGNVWEWVSDDVHSGQWQEITLPEEGYVAQVNSEGMVVGTESRPNELFNADYFWSSADDIFGMLRGGFYNSEDDAGLYAVHAETKPTTAGTAIGFRCVR